MSSNTSTAKQALLIVFLSLNDAKIFVSGQRKAVRPPVTDVFWATRTKKVNPADRPTATKLVLDISSRSSQWQGKAVSLSPTRVPISLRTALTSMQLNTTPNGHAPTSARGPGSVASTTTIGVATGVTAALIISVILIAICCFRGRRRKKPSVSPLSISLPQPQVPESKSPNPNSSTRGHPEWVTSSEQKHIVWKDSLGMHHSSYLSLPRLPPPPDAHPAFRRSASASDTPPVFLKPPSRPRSRPRTPHIPVNPVLPPLSMPGQRFPPPRYPPPQTPPMPPRSSSSSEPFSIAQSNRESTPLSSSWRAASSLYGSDAGDSRATTSTSVYSFLPGASRHSLLEGFIPTLSVSSAASNSAMIRHSGEVVVHSPSISLGAEIPPPTAVRKYSIQRIEEEDPSVSPANSSILNYGTTKNTPCQEAGRSRPASLSPKQMAQTDSTPRSSVQDCVNSPHRYPSTIGIALSPDIGTDQSKFPSRIEFRGSGISKIPSGGIRSDDSQSCKMSPTGTRDTGGTSVAARSSFSSHHMGTGNFGELTPITSPPRATPRLTYGRSQYTDHSLCERTPPLNPPHLRQGSLGSIYSPTLSMLYFYSSTESQSPDQFSPTTLSSSTSGGKRSSEILQDRNAIALPEAFSEDDLGPPTNNKW